MSDQIFAKISLNEINRLAKNKASGLQILVYQILCAHDWNKGYCFPSIERIEQLLDWRYHTNSISRALKWLDDQNFISRGKRKSVQRFQMSMRTVVEKVKKTVFNKSVIPENKSVCVIEKPLKGKKNYYNNKKKNVQKISKKEHLRRQAQRDKAQLLEKQKTTELLQNLNPCEGPFLTYLTASRYGANPSKGIRALNLSKIRLIRKELNTPNSSWCKEQLKSWGSQIFEPFIEKIDLK